MIVFLFAFTQRGDFFQLDSAVEFFPDMIILHSLMTDIFEPMPFPTVFQFIF